MAKRKQSVDRWVMANNSGHFSQDEHGASFSEDLADAYVFVRRPVRTEAVRAVEVTVTIVRGAE
jgi:hypothetical protein